MLTCGKKVAGQISYAPQNPWIIHSMSNLGRGTVTARGKNSVDIIQIFLRKAIMC